VKLSSKYTSLKKLSSYIKNGTSIGVGGHHFARLPITLINEVLKKNPKNLEFIAWSGGLALELFLQKKSINKTLSLEDYSIFFITLLENTNKNILIKNPFVKSQEPFYRLYESYYNQKLYYI
jgi:hypothetical protein